MDESTEVDTLSSDIKIFSFARLPRLESAALDFIVPNVCFQFLTFQW